MKDSLNQWVDFKFPNYDSYTDAEGYTLDIAAGQDAIDFFVNVSRTLKARKPGSPLSWNCGRPLLSVICSAGKSRMALAGILKSIILLAGKMERRQSLLGWPSILYSVITNLEQTSLISNKPAFFAALERGEPRGVMFSFFLTIFYSTTQ